jgi:hypothetical protein
VAGDQVGRRGDKGGRRRGGHAREGGLAQPASATRRWWLPRGGDGGLPVAAGR